MILLFSGTGNTRYAAEMLSAHTGDKIVDIAKVSPTEISEIGERLILMFPIYAWGPVPMMIDYIDSLPEKVIESINSQNIPVSVVCSCGDETGKGVEIMRKTLESRGANLAGAWSLIMPNVYVLLPGFDVDKKELSERKLDSVVGRIREISKDILNNRYFFDVNEGSFASLKTGVVYPLFKRWGINYKKWRWTKECIACGRCAAACPVKNIAMKGGHPEWGTNCKSCLACYGVCPTHAVAYGRMTEFKGQYYCRRRGSSN